MRRLALIAALIVLAAHPAMAAKPVPGSSCVGQNTGAFTTSAGQETGGITYFLVCDGTNWQSFGVASHASHNAGFGYGVLYTSGGTNNTAVGDGALTANTTGTQNVAIGSGALTANTTGSTNAAIGFGTLFHNLAGASSIAIGYEALFAATTGSNIAIGNQALFNTTAGFYNIALGIGTGGTLTTGTNNILIGNTVNVPANNTSNFLNIDNAIFATGMTGTLAAPAGKVGINTTAPAAPLHVNGEAIVGMQALACAAGTAGAIRYNSGTSKVQFCNGASWADVASGVTASPAGSNKQVQLNDHGILYASSGLTFNSASGILAVAGKVGIGAAAPTHTLEVSGNATMTNTANGGTAIAGIESSVGSGNFGVYGSSTGTSSAGIYGTAGWNSYGGQFNNSYTGVSGNQIALYASSSQPAGIGVYALCPGLGGQPCSYAAIKGEISGANNPANTAKAVYGINDPSPTSTGTNWGGYFETTSTGAGTGVTGVESGASNTGYAGYFTNNSATGWGVYSSGTGPNYFAGKVGIGQTSPKAALDVSGAVKISDGSTSCATVGAGGIRYNSANPSLEFCDGTSWKTVGGRVLISTQTASASASLQFSGANWSSSYNTLFLNCADLMVSTNAVAILIRIGEGAGPTWETGAHYVNQPDGVSNATDLTDGIGTVANTVPVSLKAI